MLTPGRYVGAEAAEDDGEPFEEKMKRLAATLREQQNATSSATGHGGRRHLPYAFTEHGVIMAANVLNSSRAVQMSIGIVREFVRLRQMLQSNAELAKKLDALEMKYDAQFKVVFQAIRELMTRSRTWRMAEPIQPCVRKSSEQRESSNQAMT